MIKTILISMCVISFTAILVFGHTVFAGEKPTIDNWQPIINVKARGMDAFLYRNESMTTENKNNKVTSVNILLSYKEPTEVTVNGKKIIIRSVVKSMIAECKSGMVAPVYDIYFSVPKPVDSSAPIAVTEYTSKIVSNATPVAKNSIMYNIMCPEYI